MSVITQINPGDPNFPWIMAALPLGVALDLILGDPPGRTYPVRLMNRLIEVVDDGVRRSVARLGGGRGGDLFGGLSVAAMVAGTATSVVWVVVDVGDSMGGVAALGVRTVAIVGGLTIRSTGDKILQAAGTANLEDARKRLGSVGERPPDRLEKHGIDQVCVAAVGEQASSAIVAPIFWLAIGGPATMWGFLALRSLREARLARRIGPNYQARVPVVLADLAESIPAVLTWMLLAVSSGALLGHFARAWRTGWQAGRSSWKLVPVWGQGTLAGALGVRLRGGRIGGGDQAEARPWVGEPIQTLDGMTVVAAVRIMQVAALLAAGLASLLLFLR